MPNMVVAASCFFVCLCVCVLMRTESHDQVNGKGDEAKYIEVVEENLLATPKNLKIGLRFTFQQEPQTWFWQQFLLL